jgi:hypothetical protein
MLPIGYILHFVTSQWDYIFGFAWMIVMLVDLPVSLVAYALAWKNGGQSLQCGYSSPEHCGGISSAE